MILYRVRNTREGRKRDEFPVGTLNFRDGKLVLEVPDRGLASRIERLFQEPFRVRVVRGSTDTFLSHAWIEIEPGDERHYDEGLRRLIQLDLTAEEE